jgi:hypothetical protein
MRVLGLFCVLLVASPALAADGEQRLLGVWKLESWYTEFKATGEKKSFFGERPNGYLVFTPEKRVLGLLTGEVIACACSTQARHVHNLPARGLREFEGFFPGLERRRRERGAVAMESSLDVATRWPHGAVGQNRA